MSASPDEDRLARLRLGASALLPGTREPDAVAATRRVVGVQAQDVRASGLALRSRVAGLTRADLDAADLVRTWTVRGTVHLTAPGDLPWLHAAVSSGHERRFAAALEQRGGLDAARALVPGVLDVLGRGPATRAGLLGELAERGFPALPPRAVNVLMPWLSAQGLVVGLADGRYRSAEPPASIPAEEALATLAHRYLAGYGPATAADLASWSGLPLGFARRALASLDDVERVGDLLALPGGFDLEVPATPGALLLAAFDAVLLGHRRRTPLVATADDHEVLPGGGMLRPVVLGRGRATGTWRVDSARRVLAVRWFARPAPAAALRAEVADVARFLGLELALGDG